MAIIDVTAKITGTSESAVQGGLRMSVTAALTGSAASGLGKQRPAPPEKPATTQRGV